MKQVNQSRDIRLMLLLVNFSCVSGLVSCSSGDIDCGRMSLQTLLIQELSLSAVSWSAI